MDDRLITIGIYTYEKAQIIKGVLENEGVEAIIQNVNLIQPVVSSGVRVRILETDLPHALTVLEMYPQLFKDAATLEKEEAKRQTRTKRVLIPIDFSDYSMRACEIGFNLAETLQAEVMLLHTYFSPYFPGAIPISDTFTYDVNENEIIKEAYKREEQEMKQFLEQLSQRMQDGILPQIPFEHQLREGIPEDEIHLFSKEYKPTLIVMGTRGKHQKELDLIGSVTAEVIDSASCPVLATPEGVVLSSPTGKNRIAFFTNFEQQDLLALDTMMRLLGNYKFKMHFIHLSDEADKWDEIKLAGIKDYFKKHYPNHQAEYSILGESNFLQNLEEFIRQNEINMLTLPARKRNIFARLFNPSRANRMLFHTDTPLLVIPLKKE